MEYTVGTRLRSQVCTTEVIVVRRPGRPLRLTCGGSDLVAMDAQPPGGTGTPAPGLDTGTLLGKRYTAAADEGLELLVTKAGQGTLAADGEVLVVKTAKPLPASD
ncbi:hypothetical protein [Dactylosporangium sp. CA-092794]|uniref:hypothetical protein n=1 Tax=Dactylosporangium sp. CA-092794 TaxID=3239929 RepID=UPI003D919962